MFIQDRVYGAVELDEPVIEKLIHTKPLQRLKRINQAGASQYLFPWKNISRLEHSIGVMLLLRRFGATLEEQIAGLLHDAPHTAFSHVIDYVYENEHHEYHERFHTSILNDPEVQNIFKKYVISDRVVHPEHFHLLEKNVPDLCADRIDYALRDMQVWKRDSERTGVKLAGLTVFQGEFMFTNLHVAEAFGRDYLEIDRENYAHPREIAIYVLLAQALRHALENKLLTQHDLFTDDEAVFDILKTRGDAYIQKKLSFLTPRMRIEHTTREHHHLFVKPKIRYIDPKVLTDKKIKRVSEISADFKKRLKNHIEHVSRGWYIDVYKE